jgi:hypothetical protein
MAAAESAFADSSQDIEELTTIASFAADDNACPSSVKMKLSSFCVNDTVRKALNQATMVMNVVVAEAYAFANLHMARLVETGEDPPKLDRNFFYRCLLCVTVNAGKDSTVDEGLMATKVAFDALRPRAERPMDIRGPYMNILPSLSITMATMASNHLWTNLEGRVLSYLGWKHPELKRLHQKIVALGLKAPKARLDREPRFARSNEDGTAKPDVEIERINTAVDIVRWLRGCGVSLPPFGQPYKAYQARKLVPLYHDIMVDTERGALLSMADPDLPRFKGRRFVMLPTKHGFTVGHVPICGRAMVAIVAKLRNAAGAPLVGPFSIGGEDYARLVVNNPRHQEYVWRKFFRVRMVASSTEAGKRQFGGQIVTDGYAVSVLMSATRALVQSSEVGPWSKTLVQGREVVNHVGVDPGGDSIVTVCNRLSGEITSYSSKRFQTVAGYRQSKRRTDRWNKGTENMVASIAKDVNMAREAGVERYTRTYLAVLRPLLAHRAEKGYRGMRFMRYVRRQKAIEEVCETIAPKRSYTVVGFGDWAGFGNSPIARQCAGPLQAIKRRLRELTSSCLLRKVWEYRTSVVCHYSHEKLVNMKATSKKRNRVTNELESCKRRRIHKVLHRKTGDGSASCHGGTWNRDANAARNILMLLMLEVHGMPRPMAFCKQLDERRREQPPPSQGVALAGPTLSESSP